MNECDYAPSLIGDQLANKATRQPQRWQHTRDTFDRAAGSAYFPSQSRRASENYKSPIFITYLIISQIHRTCQWASCAEGEFEGHISCRLKVNIVQWPFRAGPLRPSNLNVEHRLSAWVAREPRWLRHIAAAFTLPARREGRRVVVPHCLPEQITSPSQISVQGRLFTDRAGHSKFLIRAYVQSKTEHPTLLSVVVSIPSRSNVSTLLCFFLISQNSLPACQGENLRPVWEMEKPAGVQMGAEQGGDEQLQVRAEYACISVFIDETWYAGWTYSTSFEFISHILLVKSP